MITTLICRIKIKGKLGEIVGKLLVLVPQSPSLPPSHSHFLSLYSTLFSFSLISFM